MTPYGRSSSPASAPLEHVVQREFCQFVTAPNFPCVGARSAVRKGRYRVRLYSRLGDPGSTEEIARDLSAFAKRQQQWGDDFATFVACFEGPTIRDEEHFEGLLWRQLQALHDYDAPQHPWDSTVSADPADPRFSFSFQSRAYFVVGLHPKSSRSARRFRWPTLVFNARSQFERLRLDGWYPRMQAVIRDRDQALQGSINPMLADYGEASEARQYAGRAVDSDWKCPFHPHQIP